MPTPGDRYVATDMVVYFIPQGSTVRTNIGCFGRNFTVTRSVKDIVATGYCDESDVHLASKKDVGMSMDLMYDNDYVIEDLLVPGDFGTIEQFPLGEVTGERKRTMECYIGSADINEPYDDVANGSVAFMNTSQAGLVNSVVP